MSMNETEPNSLAPDRVEIDPSKEYVSKAGNIVPLGKKDQKVIKRDAPIKKLEDGTEAYVIGKETDEDGNEKEVHEYTSKTKRRECIEVNCTNERQNGSSRCKSCVRITVQLDK